MLEVMADPLKPTAQLLNDVFPFVARHGGTVGLPTSVPRLTLWTSTRATSPTPAVFEPMFYAVLRGTKVLTMGANRFELLAGACAASSFGLPYIHQLTGATPELPYVGISLHLDIGMLTRVMLDMPKQEDRWTCAVAAGDLNGPVGDAFARLVGLLATPDDAARARAALRVRTVLSSAAELDGRYAPSGRPAKRSVSTAQDCG
ncbi:AraC family transcriptional regulator [Rhizobium yanglingense]